MAQSTKTLGLTLATWIAASVVVHAADIALVIGNTDNSRSERRMLDGLEEAYRDDGFEVISGRDLRADEMAEVLREFEDDSRDADRAVIHFTGDVIPSRTNLRLKPADMRSGSIVAIDYAAASMDLLYELLAHRPGRSALIIATPRDDSLDLIENGPDIPQGILVLTGAPRTLNPVIRDQFLEGADAVSLNRRNGVFATGFVSDIPMTSSQDTAPVVTSRTASDAALVEMRVWREATQNGSREALQSYVDRYPRGLFLGEAKARLAALGPEVPPEKLVEDALKLTRNDRRQIQKNLTLLGFNTRGVDGIFGRGTRTAVTNWQKSEGFRETGFLDRAQIRVLTQTAKAKAEADKDKRDAEDLAFWQNNGADGSEAGLRTYLINFPEGLFAAQAKRSLDAIEAEKNKNDNSELLAKEQALGLNRQTRTLAEQRLAGLGFDVGRVDGEFDDKTRAAIQQFQQNSNLPATGFLNERTVTLLVASIFR